MDKSLSGWAVEGYRDRRYRIVPGLLEGIGDRERKLRCGSSVHLGKPQVKWLTFIFCFWGGKAKHLRSANQGCALRCAHAAHPLDMLHYGAKKKASPKTKKS
jgi:hypothetical protein